MTRAQFHNFTIVVLSRRSLVDRDEHLDHISEVLTGLMSWFVMASTS